MKRSCILFLILILTFLIGCTKPAEKPQGTTKPTKQQPHQPGEGTSEQEPGETTNNAENGEEPGTTEESPHPASIMNNPPVITEVKLVNSTGDSLTLEPEATDKDGDDVSFRYKWTVNGNVVSEDPTVKGLKKGDNIVATVTPFDGKQEGQASSYVKVLTNTPPKITASQPVYNDPNWTLQIQASDPDGDPLVYSLTKRPAGMTVDTKSGLVSWNTKGVAEGEYSGVAEVNDGQGGKADYSFNITLSAEPKN